LPVSKGVITSATFPVVEASIVLTAPDQTREIRTWVIGSAATLIFRNKGSGEYTLAVTEKDGAQQTTSYGKTFSVTDGYNITLTICLGGNIFINIDHSTPTPTGNPNPAPIAEMHTETVFDDALADQFQDDCWEPVVCQYQQTTTVFRGANAQEVTTGEGGWGAFGVFRRNADWTQWYPMYPNQYKNITFYFNPGAAFTDDVNIILSMEKDTSAPLKDYLPAVVNPDQWYFVRIPFSAFNSDDSFFYRIVLFN